MAASKPRLIPWLIDQIDSGRYPGLQWTNEEHTEFCIPWKHGLRQDSSHDDVRIFKAWAEVSGVYVEGRTPADASVWKRNFRSALRAKGCVMISDNKNDAANPHKVYRLPKDEQPRRPREAVVNPGPDLAQTSPSLVFDNLYVAEDAINHSQVLFPEQQLLAAGAEYLPPAGQATTANPDLLEMCLDGLNICEPQQALANMLPREEQHQQVAVDPGMQRVEGFKEQMKMTMVDEILRTNFRVVAYYRGTKVYEQMVEDNTGFKVMFRRENMESMSPFTEDNLTRVYLPSPEEVNIYDQTQVKLTRRILEKLGDGLEVGVHGSAVYGLRRGDSKIYWSLCKFEKRETPREVRKQEPESLYTIKDFIRGLMEFMDDGHASPSFSLFFCLGEKWPDPEHRHWEKKLIMLEVAITAFEFLKMIAVDGGASSLKSVELEISDTPSLMEILEEMMDLY